MGIAYSAFKLFLCLMAVVILMSALICSPYLTEAYKQRKRRLRREKKEQEEIARDWSNENSRFSAFVECLDDYYKEAKDRNYSIFKFNEAMMLYARNVIDLYRNSCPDVRRRYQFVPDFHYQVMRQICERILEYSGGKHLGSSLEGLSKLLKERLGVQRLGSLIYRNTNSIHYNDRCDLVVKTILDYYANDVRGPMAEYPTKPMKYLDDIEMFTIEDANQHFHQATIALYLKNQHDPNRVVNDNVFSDSPGTRRIRQENQKQRSKRMRKRSKHIKRNSVYAT